MGTLKSTLIRIRLFGIKSFICSTVNFANSWDIFNRADLLLSLLLLFLTNVLDAVVLVLVLVATADDNDDADDSEAVVDFFLVDDNEADNKDFV